MGRSGRASRASVASGNKESTVRKTKNDNTVISVASSSSASSSEDDRDNKSGRPQRVSTRASQSTEKSNGKSGKTSNKSQAEPESKLRRPSTGPASSKPTKRSRGDSVSSSGSSSSDVSGGSEGNSGSGSSRSSSGSSRLSDDRETRDSKQTKSARSLATKSGSKKRNGKRLQSGYVLEHDLERPPRRKTRPIEDGETIGDAMFFGDDLMFGLTGGDKNRLRVPWPERLRERLVNDAGLRLVMGGMPGRTSRWDDAKMAEKLGASWCKPSDFNGLYQFGTVFSSHSPAVVVIALGTNDLKPHVRKEAVKVMKENAASFSFRQDLSSAEWDEMRWAEREEKRAARMMHEENAENEDDPEDEEVEPDPVFDAETVARAVGSVALKARRLFKGHCHEGDLRLVVVVPPAITLTPFAQKAGFDAESVRLSKQLPGAFARVAKEWNIRLVNLPQFQSHTWSDGIHPSDQAAGLLAEECWNVIAEGLKRRPKPLLRV